MALFDPKAKTIASYQNKIKENNAAIDKNYYEIGKMYCDQYKDMSLDVTKDINSRCDKVVNLEKDNDALELSILFEKGLKLCKNCKKENSLVHAFCFACGAKFDEDSSNAPSLPSATEQASADSAPKADEEKPSEPVAEAKAEEPKEETETNLFV